MPNFRNLYSKGVLYMLANSNSEVKEMEYLVYMQMIVKKKKREHF